MSRKHNRFQNHIIEYDGKCPDWAARTFAWGVVVSFALFICFALISGCDHGPSLVGSKVRFVGSNRTGVIAVKDSLGAPVDTYKVVYFDELGIRRYDYVRPEELEIIE